MSTLKEIHKGLKRCSEGDPVATYLRGIGVTKVPDNVYFHPGLKLIDVADYKEVDRGLFPAMVIPYRDSSGVLVAYEIRYLPDKLRYVGVLQGGSAHFGEPETKLIVAVNSNDAMLFHERTDNPVWCAGVPSNMENICIPANVKEVGVLAGTGLKNRQAAYGFASKWMLIGKVVKVILQTSVDEKIIDVYDDGKVVDLVEFYSKNW